MVRECPKICHVLREYREAADLVFLSSSLATPLLHNRCGFITDQAESSVLNVCLTRKTQSQTDDLALTDLRLISLAQFRTQPGNNFVIRSGQTNRKRRKDAFLSQSACA
jgi:hypothetical protein